MSVKNPTLARASIEVLGRDGTTSGRQGRNSKAAKVLRFDFNPESLDIKYEHKISKSRSDKREQVQHLGPTKVSLSFEAVFDTTRPSDTKGSDGAKGQGEQAHENSDLRYDVREKTKAFRDLLDTPIDESSTGARKGKSAKRRATLVEFRWGSIQFVGVVSSFSETLNYFSPSGVPLRAKCSFSMEGVDPLKRVEPDEAAKANESATPGAPGSGGPPQSSDLQGSFPPNGDEPQDSNTRFDQFLNELDFDLNQANEFAAQNRLDSLIDVRASALLNANLELSLAGPELDLRLQTGLSARADLDLDLGFDVALSPQSPGLSVEASIDVFGERAVSQYTRRNERRDGQSRPRGNPWAPEGPAPDSREAGVVRGLRAEGFVQTTGNQVPLDWHFRPSYFDALQSPRSAVLTARDPMGSPQQLALQYGEVPLALRSSVESADRVDFSGRPRWEGWAPPARKEDPAKW